MKGVCGCENGCLTPRFSSLTRILLFKGRNISLQDEVVIEFEISPFNESRIEMYRRVLQHYEKLHIFEQY